MTHHLRNSSRWIATCVGVAAIIAGIGCDPNARPPNGRSDPLPREQYSRIQAIGTLDQFLLFSQAIIADGDEQRPMSVEVPVRTRANYAINVQYRFEYFGKAGNKIGGNDESWVYQQMEPKQDYRFKGIGTNPEAADYRLIVRPAR